MRILEHRDRHALFSTGAWLLLALLLVRQVIVYGTQVPFNDDWILMRMLRPDVPFDPHELWWVHNEHRIPLPKLAWLATVGGLHDVRAGTWLTAILISASAWVCIATARRLRGRAHFTDAFFPLVLMHGAQAENTLNSFQLQFSLCAALTVLGLVLVAISDERPGPLRVIALGFVTLALPLSGGSGLPHVVAWIAWFVLVWRSARLSQDAGERRTGRIALAFVLGVAALTAWYFVDFKVLPGFRAPTPGLLLETALQFMSRGIGETAVLVRPLGSAVVVALLVWTLGVLVWAYFGSDTSRARAIGIAVVIAAMTGTALAVGYGRAMDGDGAGLLERYGLISAPLWCAFGVAAALAWDRRWSRALAWVLFVLAAASWLPNFLAGEREGRLRRTRAEAFEEDLRRGRSIEELAQTRWRDFYYSPEGFGWVLHDLEAARLGPFREGAPPTPSTQPAPPFDVFRTAPSTTVAPSDLQSRRSGGVPVLMVRDGLALEFGLGAKPQEVEGAFGIHSELVAMGQAPRVRFQVELHRADGTLASLFELALDATHVPADRAEQRFRVPLDASAASGTIVLRITHESEPKVPWAGFWRDVLVR